MAFTIIFILFAEYMRDWTPYKFAIVGVVIIAIILAVESTSAVRGNRQNKGMVVQEPEKFPIDDMTTEWRTAATS